MRKRFLALALALCLVSGFPVHAEEFQPPGGLDALSFAAGTHTYYRSHTYKPAADTAYAVNTLLHGQTHLEEEHILAFQPNENLRPIVFGSDTIYGHGMTLQEAVSLAKSRGYDVVGGINAGYFNMSYMTPVGLQIRNGTLTSLNFYTEPCVGFLEDGSAIFGEPNISVTISSTGGTVTVDRLNKVRSPDLVYLYTPEFSENTRTTQDGMQVILKVSGQLSLGGAITGTVTQAINGKTPHTLAADEMVLSASSKSAIDRLACLPVGSAVTITATCSDTRWNNALFAVGCMSYLVKNGQNQNASDNARSPRTAIGLTAGGSVVLYTVDGRQNGYSAGLTLGELGERMIELGCVTAYELDGGGSTSLSVRLPGEADSKLVNKPSESSQRKCADFILLCNTAPPSDGRAVHLFPQPAYATMMPGTAVTFSLLATDEHYRPVPAPTEGIALVSSDGEATDGTAYFAFQTGQKTLTFQSVLDGITGTAQVSVTDQLDTLALTDADTGIGLTALSLTAGKTVSLKASGIWNRMPVAASAYCFDWTVEGDIGILTPEGVFTASIIPNQTGTITVTGGGQTVSIPVTIEETYDNGIRIDIQPPVPDEETGELVYQLTVTDETGAPCPEVIVRWDGTYLPDILWDGVTATVRVPMPDSGLHILSVEATDSLGRRARAEDTPFFGRQETDDSIKDIGESEWYTGYVDFLDVRGILDTETAEDGRRSYAPLRSVTRLEVMYMFARVLALDLNGPAYMAQDPLTPVPALPFIDLDGLSAEDLAVVRAVVNAGLVSGKPTEAGMLLDPNGSMTRSELFYILYETLPPGYALSRLTEYSDTAAIPTFSRRAVQTLVGMRVVSGANGRINPLDTITRAETAALLCRFFY